MNVNIAANNLMQAPPTAEADTAKLREIANDFESFFLYQVVSLMQPPSMSENEIFGGGYGEEMFQNTMNEQVANELAQRGGLGISDVVFQQLLTYQENAQ